MHERAVLGLRLPAGTFLRQHHTPLGDVPDFKATLGADATICGLALRRGTEITVSLNAGAHLGRLEILAFRPPEATALVISWGPTGSTTVGGIPVLPDGVSASVECVDGKPQIRLARLAQPTRFASRTFPAESDIIRHPIQIGGAVAWAHIPKAHTIDGLRLPAGTEVLFDFEGRLRRVWSSKAGVVQVGSIRCELGEANAEILFHENGRLLECPIPDGDTVAGVPGTILARFYDSGAPCIVWVADESRSEKFTTVAFDRQGRSIPPPRPYTCEH